MRTIIYHLREENGRLLMERETLMKRNNTLEETLAAVLEKQEHERNWNYVPYRKHSSTNCEDHQYYQPTKRNSYASIPTSDRFTPIEDERFTKNSYVNDDVGLADFFSSQRALRRQRNSQPDAMPKKQRGNRKDQAVVIGDSQVKYLIPENLTTTDIKVQVRSVSGLKVEQTSQRFSRELNQNSIAHVIVHVGTNSAEHYSVDELSHQYSDLAYDLIEKCTKITLSSVIRRGDKPLLNEEIDYLNDKLYDICKTLSLNFVRNDNISASNLSRDGLHLNRSGQSKLAANILNVLS